MRILYTRPDGGISIMTPLPTEDLTLEAIIEKDVPKDSTNIKVIEDDQIPADRTYRDAWMHADGVISVHMPKAREIHRNHLRYLRKPKLEALDVDYMRALEARDGDAGSHVSAQKQMLRDITKHPAIEAAQTPEELKLAAMELLA